MARLASNLPGTREQGAPRCFSPGPCVSRSTHEYLDRSDFPTISLLASGWPARYKNQILDKMHETDISIRRQAGPESATAPLRCVRHMGLQALNLLYALCRLPPSALSSRCGTAFQNGQLREDQAGELAADRGSAPRDFGSSDNLLQEELTGNERASGFRGPALVNHLSRQELVLKIAILAEKNAKNIAGTWMRLAKPHLEAGCRRAPTELTQVVFKMLESAPDAVRGTALVIERKTDALGAFVTPGL